MAKKGAKVPVGRVIDASRGVEVGRDTLRISPLLMTYEGASATYGDEVCCADDRSFS